MAVFSEWIAPSLPLRNHLPYNESLLAVVIFGILLLVLMVSLAWAWLVCTRERTQNTAQQMFPFIVFGTFLLVSLILFPLTMSSTGHGVQTRFLVPLYIPLLFTLLFAIDWGVHHVKKTNGTLMKFSKFFNLTIPILLVLHVAYQTSLNVQSIIRANSIGTPYTFSTPRWHNSEVIKFVSDSQTGRKIFSPTIPPVYIFTDGSASEYKFIYGGKEVIDKALNESVEGDYFILFHEEPCNCNRSDFYFSPKLRLAAELNDGVIFERIDK